MRRIWRAIVVFLILALLTVAGVIWHDWRVRQRDAALIAAVEAGNAAEVQLCLEAGANPDARIVPPVENARDVFNSLRGGRQGQTALTLAVAGKQWDIVELLVDRGAEVSEVTGIEMLHAACADSAVGAARALLDRGVAVDGRASHGMHDPAGRTALMTAVVNGNPAVVRLLLERGADWKQVLVPHSSIYSNGRQIGALSWYRGGLAKWNGEAVRALVEHGLPANTLLDPREPLLVTATLAGDRDSVAFLLARGALVDSKDDLGWTAMYYAEIQSKPEIVALLKRAGAKKYW